MLSAKSRYAIISVVDIAINQEQGKCVSVSEIAKRQQISEKFLESILPSLRKNGLLTSVLGPGGGYKLAKKASSITLIQITDSVKQSLKVTRCNQENSCIKSSAKCATHNLWSLLERKMHDLLNKITVQDVILGDFNKNRNSNETDSNHDFIYMDNNATMKTKDCAKEKISECLNLPYNPSSVHHIGQAARKIVEYARYNIKHQLGAQQDYNLIFTSSGTEANNLIFNSFLDYHHIISAVEHSSVLKSAKNPIFIPVDCNGRVDIEKLKFLLEQVRGKKLVSIIFANNETGVVQDMQSIAKIAKQNGALLHTDAVQALGKVEFLLQDTDIDFATISSHKIGGGLGAGGLIYKKLHQIKPMLYGGGQEFGIRPGTENVAAIAGFSAAASLLQDSVACMQSEVKKLRDYMEGLIFEKMPGCKIAGKDAIRLPNTSCVIVPGFENTTQLMHFDLHKICVSSGSACSSGQVEPSGVLLAMGSKESDAKSAIRISLCAQNTKNEIEKLANTWCKMYNGS